MAVRARIISRMRRIMEMIIVVFLSGSNCPALLSVDRPS
jgi:hypothetical protein